MINDDDDDDHVSSAPLSAEERRAIRQLLLDESRAKWLWASIRVWAAWIGAVVIFIITVQDWLVNSLKRLFGH